MNYHSFHATARVKGASVQHYADALMNLLINWYFNNISVPRNVSAFKSEFESLKPKTRSACGRGVIKKFSVHTRPHEVRVTFNEIFTTHF